MAIKMYSRSQSQWVDYNEELVNETVGTIFLNNRWKIAWKGLHAHNGKRFTRWTSSNSLPSTAGNYVLMNDVTISSTWAVPNGETNICLNGHRILWNGNTTTRMIQLDNSNKVLNLYDCNHDHSTDYSVTNPVGGTTEITTGLITGGKSGCVYVDGGTFNMYGGAIAGNKVTGALDTPLTGWGAALLVVGSGIFNMYNGLLACNSSSQAGGGAIRVTDNGEVNIYEGVIKNNIATFGGGVSIAKSAILNITGDDSVFDGNVANEAYVIDDRGGGAINFGGAYTGKCFISGGKFLNNVSYTHGGAIQLNNGTVNISKVEIRNNKANAGNGGGLQLNSNGVLELSGKIIARSNYRGNNNVSDNIYLVNNKKITVKDMFQDESEIGISMATIGVFTSDYSTYNTDAPSTFFTSDNTSYEVVLASGEAKLQAK